MKVIGAGVISLLVCIYPFVIYFGAIYLEPRYLALFLGALLCLRFLAGKNRIFDLQPRHKILFLMAGIFLVLLTVVNNSLASLKLYPVVVSLSLLSVFAYSLFYPPTIIEKIARFQDPDLPPAAVIYTRQVTKIWCAFFILNSLISLYTSLFASAETWILYNGLISYLLMGGLFAGEFLYRIIVIKPKHNADKHF